MILLILFSSCATIPQYELNYAKKPKEKYHIRDGISTVSCNKE